MIGRLWVMPGIWLPAATICVRTCPPSSSRSAGEAPRAAPSSQFGEVGDPIHQGVSGSAWGSSPSPRSEEHTSELQSRFDLVCRLLLEKKNYQLWYKDKE